MDFWQTIETKIGSINPFLKKLLDHTFYNTYSSFKGLSETDINLIFTELEEVVHALKDVLIVLALTEFIVFILLRTKFRMMWNGATMVR